MGKYRGAQMTHLRVWRVGDVCLRGHGCIILHPFFRSGKTKVWKEYPEEVFKPISAKFNKIMKKFDYDPIRKQ